MGPLVKGGLLRAARRLRGGVRLERPLLRAAARPQPLLRRRRRVRRRQPLRALADGRDRRRLLQQGARCSEPPTTLEEFEAALAGGQGRRATSRSSSATSTSGRASTSTRPCSGRPPTRTQVRDFVFAREGATFDTPEFQRGRREAAGAGPTKGYFTPDFNGTGYDPAWQQFAQGQGPLPDRGHLAGRRPRRSDGRRRRLHAAAAAPRRAPTRSRSAARACRSRSPRSPRTRTWRPRTSTSSRTPTPATVLAETGNLPAMPVDESAIPEGARRPRCSTAWDAAERAATG